MKRTAKSCFGVQKNDFLIEFSAFLQPFYQKRIKPMVIREECRFLLKQPRNMC